MDYDALVRKEMRSTLEGYADIDIVGVASDGFEAINLGANTSSKYRAHGCQNAPDEWTRERPCPLDLKLWLFLTLGNGEELHPIFIGSTIVRWSDGRYAGGEIQRMDALSHVHLADIMKQNDPSVVPLEGVLSPAEMAYSLGRIPDIDLEWSTPA